MVISFKIKNSGQNKSAYALQREEEEKRAREEQQHPTVISLEKGEVKVNDESVTRKKEKTLYVIPIPAKSSPSNRDEKAGEEADYDQVPLGEFGLAFLRGCGWRKEVGIGRTNARRVKMRLPKPRPDRQGCGWKEGRDKKRSKQLVKKRKRKSAGRGALQSTRREDGDQGRRGSHHGNREDGAPEALQVTRVQQG